MLIDDDGCAASRLNAIAGLALSVIVPSLRLRPALEPPQIHRFAVGLKPRYKNLSAHARATGDF
jgi:hypothetical protein